MQVRVVEVSGHWAWVDANGATGWVPKKCPPPSCFSDEMVCWKLEVERSLSLRLTALALT